MDPAFGRMQTNRGGGSGIGGASAAGAGSRSGFGGGSGMAGSGVGAAGSRMSPGKKKKAPPSPKVEYSKGLKVPIPEDFMASNRPKIDTKRKTGKPMESFYVDPSDRKELEVWKDFLLQYRGNAPANQIQDPGSQYLLPLLMAFKAGALRTRIKERDSDAMDELMVVKSGAAGDYFTRYLSESPGGWRMAVDEIAAEKSKARIFAQKKAKNWGYKERWERGARREASMSLASFKLPVQWVVFKEMNVIVFHKATGEDRSAKVYDLINARFDFELHDSRTTKPLFPQQIPVLDEKGRKEQKLPVCRIILWPPDRVGNGREDRPLYIYSADREQGEEWLLLVKAARFAEKRDLMSWCVRRIVAAETLFGWSNLRLQFEEKIREQEILNSFVSKLLNLPAAKGMNKWKAYYFHKQERVNFYIKYLSQELWDGFKRRQEKCRMEVEELHFLSVKQIQDSYRKRKDMDKWAQRAERDKNTAVSGGMGSSATASRSRGPSRPGSPSRIAAMSDPFAGQAAPGGPLMSRVRMAKIGDALLCAFQPHPATMSVPVTNVNQMAFTKDPLPLSLTWLNVSPDLKYLNATSIGSLTETQLADAVVSQQQQAMSAGGTGGTAGGQSREAAAADRKALAAADKHFVALDQLSSIIVDSTRPKESFKFQTGGWIQKVGKVVKRVNDRTQTLAKQIKLTSGEIESPVSMMNPPEEEKGSEGQAHWLTLCGPKLGTKYGKQRGQFGVNRDEIQMTDVTFSVGAMRFTELTNVLSRVLAQTQGAEAASALTQTMQVYSTFSVLNQTFRSPIVTAENGQAAFNFSGKCEVPLSSDPGNSQMIRAAVLREAHAVIDLWQVRPHRLLLSACVSISELGGASQARGSEGLMLNASLLPELPEELANQPGFNGILGSVEWSASTGSTVSVPTNKRNLSAELLGLARLKALSSFVCISKDHATDGDGRGGADALTSALESLAVRMGAEGKTVEDPHSLCCYQEGDVVEVYIDQLSIAQPPDKNTAYFVEIQCGDVSTCTQLVRVHKPGARVVQFDLHEYLPIFDHGMQGEPARRAVAGGSAPESSFGWHPSLGATARSVDGVLVRVKATRVQDEMSVSLQDPLAPGEVLGPAQGDVVGEVFIPFSDMEVDRVHDAGGTYGLFPGGQARSKGMDGATLACKAGYTGADGEKKDPALSQLVAGGDTFVKMQVFLRQQGQAELRRHYDGDRVVLPGDKVLVMVEVEQKYPETSEMFRKKGCHLGCRDEKGPTGERLDPYEIKSKDKKFTFNERKKGSLGVPLRRPCNRAEHAEGGLLVPYPLVSDANAAALLNSGGMYVVDDSHNKQVTPLPLYCRGVVPHVFRLAPNEFEHMRRKCPGNYKRIRSDGFVPGDVVTRLTHSVMYMPATVLGLRKDRTAIVQIRPDVLTGTSKPEVVDDYLQRFRAAIPKFVDTTDFGSGKRILSGVPLPMIVSMMECGASVYDSKVVRDGSGSLDTYCGQSASCPLDVNSYGGMVPVDSNPSFAAFEWTMHVCFPTRTKMIEWATALRLAIRESAHARQVQFAQVMDEKERRMKLAKLANTDFWDAKPYRVEEGRLEIVVVEASLRKRQSTSVVKKTTGMSTESDTLSLYLTFGYGQVSEGTARAMSQDPDHRTKTRQTKVIRKVVRSILREWHPDKVGQAVMGSVGERQAKPPPGIITDEMAKTAAAEVFPLSDFPEPCAPRNNLIKTLMRMNWSKLQATPEFTVNPTTPDFEKTPGWLEKMAMVGGIEGFNTIAGGTDHYRVPFCEKKEMRSTGGAFFKTNNLDYGPATAPQMVMKVMRKPTYGGGVRSDQCIGLVTIDTREFTDVEKPFKFIWKPIAPPMTYSLYEYEEPTEEEQPPEGQTFMPGVSRGGFEMLKIKKCHVSRVPSELRLKEKALPLIKKAGATEKDLNISIKQSKGKHLMVGNTLFAVKVDSPPADQLFEGEVCLMVRFVPPVGSPVRLLTPAWVEQSSCAAYRDDERERRRDTFDFYGAPVDFNGLHSTFDPMLPLCKIPPGDTPPKAAGGQAPPPYLPLLMPPKAKIDFERYLYARYQTCRGLGDVTQMRGLVEWAKWMRDLPYDLGRGAGLRQWNTFLDCWRGDGATADGRRVNAQNKYALMLLQLAAAADAPDIGAPDELEWEAQAIAALSQKENPTAPLFLAEVWLQGGKQSEFVGECWLPLPNECHKFVDSLPVEVEYVPVLEGGGGRRGGDLEQGEVVLPSGGKLQWVELKKNSGIGRWLLSSQVPLSRSDPKKKGGGGGSTPTQLWIESSFGMSGEGAGTLSVSVKEIRNLPSNAGRARPVVQVWAFRPTGAASASPGGVVGKWDSAPVLNTPVNACRKVELWDLSHSHWIQQERHRNPKAQPKGPFYAWNVTAAAFTGPQEEESRERADAQAHLGRSGPGVGGFSVEVPVRLGASRESAEEMMARVGDPIAVAKTQFHIAQEFQVLTQTSVRPAPTLDLRSISMSPESSQTIWRLCKKGMASCMRPYLWTQFSGAFALKMEVEAFFKNQLMPALTDRRNAEAIDWEAKASNSAWQLLVAKTREVNSFIFQQIVEDVASLRAELQVDFSEGNRPQVNALWKGVTEVCKALVAFSITPNYAWETCPLTCEMRPPRSQNGNAVGQPIRYCRSLAVLAFYWLQAFLHGQGQLGWDWSTTSGEGGVDTAAEDTFYFLYAMCGKNGAPFEDYFAFAGPNGPKAEYTTSGVKVRRAPIIDRQHAAVRDAVLVDSAVMILHRDVHTALSLIGVNLVEVVYPLLISLFASHLPPEALYRLTDLMCNRLQTDASFADPDVAPKIVTAATIAQDAANPQDAEAGDASPVAAAPPRPNFYRDPDCGDMSRARMTLVCLAYSVVMQAVHDLKLHEIFEFVTEQSFMGKPPVLGRGIDPATGRPLENPDDSPIGQVQSRMGQMIGDAAANAGQSMASEGIEGTTIVRNEKTRMCWSLTAGAFRRAVQQVVGTIRDPSTVVLMVENGEKAVFANPPQRGSILSVLLTRTQDSPESMILADQNKILQEICVPYPLTFGTKVPAPFTKDFLSASSTPTQSGVYSEAIPGKLPGVTTADLENFFLPAIRYAACFTDSYKADKDNPRAFLFVRIDAIKNFGNPGQHILPSVKVTVSETSKRTNVGRTEKISEGKAGVDVRNFCWEQGNIFVHPLSQPSTINLTLEVFNDVPPGSTLGKVPSEAGRIVLPEHFIPANPMLQQALQNDRSYVPCVSVCHRDLAIQGNQGSGNQRPFLTVSWFLLARRPGPFVEGNTGNPGQTAPFVPRFNLGQQTWGDFGTPSLGKSDEMISAVAKIVDGYDEKMNIFQGGSKGVMRNLKALGGRMLQQVASVAGTGQQAATTYGSLFQYRPQEQSTEDVPGGSMFGGLTISQLQSVFANSVIPWTTHVEDLMTVFGNKQVQGESKNAMLEQLQAPGRKIFLPIVEGHSMQTLATQRPDLLQVLPAQPAIVSLRAILSGIIICSRGTVAHKAALLFDLFADSVLPNANQPSATHAAQLFSFYGFAKPILSETQKGRVMSEVGNPIPAGLSAFYEEKRKDKKNLQSEKAKARLPYNAISTFACGWVVRSVLGRSLMPVSGIEAQSMADSIFDAQGGAGGNTLGTTTVQSAELLEGVSSIEDLPQIPGKGIDVTAAVKRFIVRMGELQTLKFAFEGSGPVPTTASCGCLIDFSQVGNISEIFKGSDPSPGQSKVLRIWYRLGDRAYQGQLPVRRMVYDAASVLFDSSGAIGGGIGGNLTNANRQMVLTDGDRPMFVLKNPEAPAAPASFVLGRKEPGKVTALDKYSFVSLFLKSPLLSETVRQLSGHDREYLESVQLSADVEIDTALADEQDEAFLSEVGKQLGGGMEQTSEEIKAMQEGRATGFGKFMHNMGLSEGAKRERQEDLAEKRGARNRCICVSFRASHTRNATMQGARDFTEKAGAMFKGQFQLLWQHGLTLDLGDTVAEFKDKVSLACQRLASKVGDRNGKAQYKMQVLGEMHQVSVWDEKNKPVKLQDHKTLADYPQLGFTALNCYSKAFRFQIRERTMFEMQELNLKKNTTQIAAASGGRRNSNPNAVAAIVERHPLSIPTLLPDDEPPTDIVEVGGGMRPRVDKLAYVNVTSKDPEKDQDNTPSFVPAMIVSVSKQGTGQAAQAGAACDAAILDFSSPQPASAAAQKDIFPPSEVVMAFGQSADESVREGGIAIALTDVEKRKAMELWKKQLSTAKIAEALTKARTEEKLKGAKPNPEVGGLNVPTKLVEQTLSELRNNRAR
uniref:Uncharacterized protein n=1 Tax=Chromera velia CCMP2878 TaxID=1169474 RepID=A0A0G4IG22_9ALVE|eukprot:Cvel_2503.t1-p1 / transcript=Cvel_2503.t1 / gene=Cvel_2503 / organism=Chromera_velia_CCMP2878 / gene_product=hypothetical protein / transcript_product=hypothetical protein / location=Cvel_scaffold98:78292-104029(-) / protein_length=4246 / sequence_SO=supercontig / SO=protein_coding / is_pseudo=false